MLTGCHQALPNYTRLPVRHHIIVSYGNNGCFVAEVSKGKTNNGDSECCKDKRALDLRQKSQSLWFPLARVAGATPESHVGMTDCLMGLELEEFGR